MTAMSTLTADEVIALLALAPHPEGGFFRETFRDTVTTGGGIARSASTAIYFLLPEGVVSRWHKVDAAEAWHWYAGAALEISIAHSGAQAIAHRLGPDLVAGERPQFVVAAGQWQQARSFGAWTLVGCTVAPGFSFEGFVIAPEGWEPGR